MGGAPQLDDLEPLLRRVGFENIQINLKEESKEFIKTWMPGTGCENYVVSAAITANKPKETKMSCNLFQIGLGLAAGSILTYVALNLMKKKK